MKKYALEAFQLNLLELKYGDFPRHFKHNLLPIEPTGIEIRQEAERQRLADSSN